jgi:Gliding motility associated protein GldN
MKKFTFSILALALLAASPLAAQIPGTNIPPRVDDHFQRNLVINRIDLDEKINRPLIATTDGGIYSGSRYTETNGMIQALVNGLKSGKYLAYDPDNLTRSLTYDEVKVIAQSKIEDSEIDIEGGDPELWPEMDESDETMEYDELGNSAGEINKGGLGSSQVEGQDFPIAPYESVVEFIENRIFDKNRSAEINDIQYIRLVWVDPGETLPDENFICLKFSDVLETLEATQWKNAFNDAEDRNMREVFEERIFNSFVLNVSGRGVRTLGDAEYQRNKMLDFEHNLWSY